ncbi:MAG: hypothetical protein HXY46_05960 [Syntrophaceae bacterium]|nr:hypothetical protein [Syntrophaceae bacterium]
MDKEVVLENEYITVWYYPQKKIVHHEFHKFTSGKTFQDALSAGAAILEKNRAQKWLSDDRKNTVIGKDDMQWTKTVWRPRVIKAGWKYWALVLPEKVIGQMVMKRIIKEYADTGVTVEIFSDPDKAMKWLEAQ